MEYISVSQFAERYGVSERTVRNYCAMGKIDGAFQVGKIYVKFGFKTLQAKCK